MTVVAAHTEVDPAGAFNHRVVTVVSARDLELAVEAESRNADIVVMAAAVADYRPAQVQDAKMKKTGEALRLELIENPDILAGLVARRRPGQIIVGFAAETGDATTDALSHGRAKAIRKGADLLAINSVGETTGFGDVTNSVLVVDSAGNDVGTASGSKTAVAAGLVDLIVGRLASA